MIVGLEAPEINASAVMANNSFNSDFKLSQYLENYYGVIFFYVMDFTYVCPTELIAINNRIDEFNKRDTRVLAISIDSIFAHRIWKNTTFAQGGIGQIKFPLLSDVNKDIAKGYGVLLNNNVAMRATFIVDKDRIVRSEQINDLPIGRNIDTIIEFIDALQYHEATSEHCPAGWSINNSRGIEATEQGVIDFLSEEATNL